MLSRSFQLLTCLLAVVSGADLYACSYKGLVDQLEKALTPTDSSFRDIARVGESVAASIKEVDLDALKLPPLDSTFSLCGTSYPQAGLMHRRDQFRESLFFNTSYFNISSTDEDPLLVRAPHQKSEAAEYLIMTRSNDIMAQNPSLDAVWFIEYNDRFFWSYYPTWDGICASSVGMNMAGFGRPYHLSPADLWEQGAWYANTRPSENPTGKAHWTEPYGDVVIVDSMVSFSVPLYTGSGEYIGVWGLDCMLPKLTATLRGHRPTPSGGVFMFDPQGYLLAARDDIVMHLFGAGRTLANVTYYSSAGVDKRLSLAQTRFAPVFRALLDGTPFVVVPPSLPVPAAAQRAADEAHRGGHLLSTLAGTATHWVLACANFTAVGYAACAMAPRTELLEAATWKAEAAPHHSSDGGGGEQASGEGTGLTARLITTRSVHRNSSHSTADVVVSLRHTGTLPAPWVLDRVETPSLLSVVVTSPTTGLLAPQQTVNLSLTISRTQMSLADSQVLVLRIRGIPSQDYGTCYSEILFPISVPPLRACSAADFLSIIEPQCSADADGAFGRQVTYQWIRPKVCLDDESTSASSERVRCDQVSSDVPSATLLLAILSACAVFGLASLLLQVGGWAAGVAVYVAAWPILRTLCLLGSIITLASTYSQLMAPGVAACATSFIGSALGSTVQLCGLLPFAYRLRKSAKQQLVLQTDWALLLRFAPVSAVPIAVALLGALVDPPQQQDIQVPLGSRGILITEVRCGFRGGLWQLLTHLSVLLILAATSVSLASVHLRLCSIASRKSAKRRNEKQNIAVDTSPKALALLLLLCRTALTVTEVVLQPSSSSAGGSSAVVFASAGLPPVVSATLVVCVTALTQAVCCALLSVPLLHLAVVTRWSTRRVTRSAKKSRVYATRDRFSTLHMADPTDEQGNGKAAAVTSMDGFLEDPIIRRALFDFLDANMMGESGAFLTEVVRFRRVAALTNSAMLSQSYSRAPDEHNRAAAASPGYASATASNGDQPLSPSSLTAQTAPEDTAPLLSNPLILVPRGEKGDVALRYAQQICSTFILQGSPQQINIPGRARLQIETQLSRGSASARMFDEAADFVQRIVRQNAETRFVGSKQANVAEQQVEWLDAIRGLNEQHQVSVLHAMLLRVNQNVLRQHSLLLNSMIFTGDTPNVNTPRRIAFEAEEQGPVQ